MPPMIYQLEPLVGVSPVHFGMSVEELKGVMPNTFTVFQKTAEGPEVHAYHHNALQMFLSAQRQVEFIQISRKEHISAVYLELDLLRTPAEEVIEYLLGFAEYDLTDPELGYTFIFKSLELALWRPILPKNKRSEDGKYFLTVGIGRSGYYSGE